MVLLCGKGLRPDELCSCRTRLKLVFPENLHINGGRVCQARARRNPDVLRQGYSKIFQGVDMFRLLVVFSLCLFAASCTKQGADELSESLGGMHVLFLKDANVLPEPQRAEMLRRYRDSLECWMADPAINTQGLVISRIEPRDNDRGFYAYFAYPDKPGVTAAKMEFGLPWFWAPNVSVFVFGPERWGATMKALKPFHQETRIILCGDQGQFGFRSSRR